MRATWILASVSAAWLLTATPLALGGEDQKTPEGRFYRAYFLEVAERQVKEALEIYCGLLDAFPERPEMAARVRFRIATCEIRLGNRETGLKFLEQALATEGIPAGLRARIEEGRRSVKAGGSDRPPNQPGEARPGEGEPLSPAPGPLLEAAGSVDASILAALDWLCRHQSPDGSWSSRDFTRWCDRTGKPCTSHNAEKYGEGRGRFLSRKAVELYETLTAPLQPFLEATSASDLPRVSPVVPAVVGWAILRPDGAFLAPESLRLGRIQSGAGRGLIPWAHESASCNARCRSSSSRPRDRKSTRSSG
jgi:hypothetical protein